MSSFDRAFGSATSAFLSTFGEPEQATYLPGELPVSVIVDKDVDARDEYGRLIMGITKISWPRSQQPNHRRQDTIRLAGGETWRLNELVEEGAFIRYRVIPV